MTIVAKALDKATKAFYFTISPKGLTYVHLVVTAFLLVTTSVIAFGWNVEDYKAIYIVPWAVSSLVLFLGGLYYFYLNPTPAETSTIIRTAIHLLVSVAMAVSHSVDAYQRNDGSDDTNFKVPKELDPVAWTGSLFLIAGPTAYSAIRKSKTSD